MPIYEYKCLDCGEVGEFLVGIGQNSDQPTCGSCGGTRLDKIMSAPAAPRNNVFDRRPAGSTCCGSNPEAQGCVPGSCCGSS